MNCIDCKTANPEESRYCGQCGAELGRTLDETVRKKGFRDRQAIEMEIADSVASRLIKWGGWLGAIAALILTSFGVALGVVYHDTRSVADAGKTQIENAVTAGEGNINTSVTAATNEIDSIRRNAQTLGKQITQLQSDIRGYKEVNGEMEKLRNEFHGQTTDLSKLDLRVRSLETVPTEGGPSSLSLGRLGCQPAALAKGAAVAYCAQGSPPFLFQRTAAGDVRPVSSSSPEGFQDESTAPKPACTSASRGTFYVEKGTGNAADKPFVCVRGSGGVYNWIQLGAP
jgi:hypothetical protein